MYRSLMGIYESYNDDEKTGLRKQNGHYQSVKQPELHNWINELPSVATEWNGLRIANNPEYFPDNPIYCQLSKYRVGIVTDGTVEPSFGFTSKTAFGPNGDVYYLYPFTLSMKKMSVDYYETHADYPVPSEYRNGPMMSVPEQLRTRLQGLYGDLGFSTYYYPGACFENMIGVRRWGSSGYWHNHVISAQDMPRYFSTGDTGNDVNLSNRTADHMDGFGCNSSYPQLNQPYYYVDGTYTQLVKYKDIDAAGDYIVCFKYISKPGFKAAYFTFGRPYSHAPINPDYDICNKKITAFSDPYAIAELQGGEYISGSHGRAFSSMRQIPIGFDPENGIIFKYTNRNGVSDDTDIHAGDVN